MRVIYSPGIHSGIPVQTPPARVLQHPLWYLVGNADRVRWKASCLFLTATIPYFFHLMLPVLFHTYIFYLTLYVL